MKKGLAFVMGWCFIVAALIFSVQLVCFDRGYYKDFYAQSGLAEELGVKEETLNEAMEMMLGYLDGSRDSMDGTMVRNGETVEVYNTREKLHMKDVRQLYRNALLAGWISLAGFFVLGLLLWVLDRSSWLFFACRGIVQAAACFLVMLCVIAFWCLTNFDSFWTSFHLLFFDNDLWLLNPATDFMIDICPENLFFGMVMRIVGLFLVFFAPVTGGALWLLKRKAPIGFEHK